MFIYTDKRQVTYLPKSVLNARGDRGSLLRISLFAPGRISTRKLSKSGLRSKKG